MHAFRMLILLILVSCVDKKEVVEDFPTPDLIPFETMEEWYPNGDGFKVVRYRLSELQLKEAEKWIKKLDYRNLPISDDMMDQLIFDYIGEQDEGWYVSEQNPDDPRDVEVVIVNRSRAEFVSFISIQ